MPLSYLNAALMLIVLTAITVPAQNPAAPPSSPPSSAAKKAESPVVARVYGAPIAEEQVLNGISQLAQQRQLSGDQLKQKDIVLFKEALDNLIAMHLLKNEAGVQKIEVDQAKVEDFLKNVIKNFPSEAEFRKLLELQGVTEATLRSAIADRVLSQQVIDANVKDVPAVTDAEVKKFYDDNPQYFQKPESVQAAHILLRVEPGSTVEKKAEIRKKLEAIRADIESKKVTFAEAAAKNSEDKSNAAKGGDLGSFPRGQMVKPFEDMAFSTKPGNLTPVFETQFGYHLVNVIALNPAGKVTLEEARGKIQEFLMNQAKQTATMKFVQGLREKGKVEILMTQEEWNQRHPVK